VYPAGPWKTVDPRRLAQRKRTSIRPRTSSASSIRKANLRHEYLRHSVHARPFTRGRPPSSSQDSTKAMWRNQTSYSRGGFRKSPEAGNLPGSHIRTFPLMGLPRPACGERVGMRGFFWLHMQLAFAVESPSPGIRACARLPTSPRKRGEVDSQPRKDELAANPLMGEAWTGLRFGRLRQVHERPLTARANRTSCFCRQLSTPTTLPIKGDLIDSVNLFGYLCQKSRSNIDYNGSNIDYNERAGRSGCERTAVQPVLHSPDRRPA
jgi:hypothetical protein